MRQFYHSLLQDVLREVVQRFRANFRSSDLPRKLLEQQGVEPAAIQELDVGYATEEWRSLVEWTAERETYYRDCARTLGLIQKGKRGLFDHFRDRLIFPVRDNDGHPVGLVSRSISSLRDNYRPKKFDESLLNSSHSPIFDKWTYLLGYSGAADCIRDHGRLVVTQDPVDLLRLRSRGCRNSVMELIPGSFDRADEESQHRRLLNRSVTLDVLTRGEKNQEESR